jgi:hypothetical protein
MEYSISRSIDIDTDRSRLLDGLSDGDFDGDLLGLLLGGCVN